MIIFNNLCPLVRPNFLHPGTTVPREVPDPPAQFERFERAPSLFSFFFLHPGPHSGASWDLGLWQTLAR